MGRNTSCARRRRRRSSSLIWVVAGAFKVCQGRQDVDLAITWPPAGAALPTSFIVTCELTVPDHLAFIESNLDARVCAGSEHLPPSEGTCEDIFTASLRVRGLPPGSHPLTAWLIGGNGTTLASAEPVIVTVDPEGPHYAPRAAASALSASPEGQAHGYMEPPTDDGPSLLEWAAGRRRAAMGLRVEGEKDLDSRRFQSSSGQAQLSPPPPPWVCDGEGLVVVVAIKSSARAFQARQAIRQTWLTEVRAQGVSASGACGVFVVGRTKADADLAAALELEQSEFGDLLLPPHVKAEDSYYGLVGKSAEAMAWATTHLRPSYVMMLDDDVYLRADELVRALKESAPKHRFYSGQVWKEQYGRPLRPQREPGHRNYLSREDFPGDELPAFALGPHYILSYDLARHVGENKDRLKAAGTLEDVSVGLWMRDLEVQPSHVAWFTNARNFPCTPGLVSYADLTPHGLRSAHASLIMSSSCAAADTAAASGANHTQSSLSSPALNANLRQRVDVLVGLEGSTEEHSMCHGFDQATWVKSDSRLSGMDAPQLVIHSPVDGGIYDVNQEPLLVRVGLKGGSVDGPWRAAGAAVTMCVEVIDEEALGGAKGCSVGGIDGAMELHGMHIGTHTVKVTLTMTMGSQADDTMLPPRVMTSVVMFDVLRFGPADPDPLPPPALPWPEARLSDGDARIHVCIMTINTDNNSQTGIFYKLARHLSRPRYRVSFLTLRINDAFLPPPLLPTLYLNVSHCDPLSLTSALEQLPSDALTIPSTLCGHQQLQHVLAFLRSQDIALTANTISHPHTPLVVQLARIADRPKIVMDLPNIHPPLDVAVDVLVAPSRFAAHHRSVTAYRQHHRDVEGSDLPVVVIHPAGLTHSASSCPPKPPHFTVLVVGRLGLSRNPCLAIAVAHALRQLAPQLAESVRFVIVGDGPLRSRLEARAASLLPEGYMTYVGGAGPQEVRCWMRRGDVVLNVAFESFGIANAEAGLEGTPVIALHRGAVPESTIPGDMRDLVRYVDEDVPKRLAEAILRRAKEGRKSYKTSVPTSWRLSSMVEAYSNLFERMLVGSQSGQWPGLPPHLPPPGAMPCVGTVTIGVTQGAWYLRNLLQQLMRRVFPTADLQFVSLPAITSHGETEQAVHSVPDVVVMSVLDGGERNQWGEAGRAAYRRYRDLYRSSVLVLWSGEAWEVPLHSLPPESRPSVMVTTLRPQPQDPPPVVPTIYMPVMSTAISELTRHRWQSLLESNNHSRPLDHGRRGGVAYLYSRCDRPAREALVPELRALGVDVDGLGVCQGSGRNPDPWRVSGRHSSTWHDDAIDLYTRYRFVLAFENSNATGYVTEKILLAFLAGAVPVYYGPQDTVRDIFDPKAFIDCSDLAERGGGPGGLVAECAARVAEVYHDERRYTSLLQHQPKVSSPSFLRDLLSWQDGAGSDVYVHHFRDAIGEAQQALQSGSFVLADD